MRSYSFEIIWFRMPLKKAALLTLLSAVTLFTLWLFIKASGEGLPWVFGWLNRQPFGDKIGHFTLMGIFTFLFQVIVHIVRGEDIDVKRDVKITAYIIAAIMTLEEFSQLFYKGRSFSLLDLTANYLGIGLFSVAAYRVLKKRAE